MEDDHDIKKETAGKAEGTELLCFLWGTHRSLSLQHQCYCQFWKSFNPVYIQISKFFTGQTDRRTKPTA